MIQHHVMTVILNSSIHKNILMISNNCKFLVVYVSLTYLNCNIFLKVKYLLCMFVVVSNYCVIKNFYYEKIKNY